MKVGEWATIVDIPKSLTLMGWEGEAVQVIEALSPSIVMVQLESVEGKIGRRQALVEDLVCLQRRLL